jgi:4-diphosphocytidyl-2-C-methyl-D-erythritol kinase
MLAFPNCKINLGLHILNKREDGFHNLETVFYPLNIKDALEVIPFSGQQLQFIQTGLTVTGSEADNSCVKAYHLKKIFRNYLLYKCICTKPFLWVQA